MRKSNLTLNPGVDSYTKGYEMANGLTDKMMLIANDDLGPESLGFE